MLQKHVYIMLQTFTPKSVGRLAISVTYSEEQIKTYIVKKFHHHYFMYTIHHYIQLHRKQANHLDSSSKFTDI